MKTTHYYPVMLQPQKPRLKPMIKRNVWKKKKENRMFWWFKRNSRKEV